MWFDTLVLQLRLHMAYRVNGILYRLRFLPEECVRCGKCVTICPMDCDPTRDPNSPECIRCGECVAVCPTRALQKPKIGAGLPDKTAPYKGVEL